MFSHFSATHSNKVPTKHAAFGLIELLVSISIMVIIVSVILVRQSSFNGAVLLRSQAYEVALQLRSIQLNAVSATSESGAFRSILGVYFDPAIPDSYRIYTDTDTPPDFFYESSEEFGLQGLIDPRFEIREIRNIGGSYDGNGISIVFERPNFDARFYDSGGQVDATSIEIDIARVGSTGTGPGDIRTVEVTSAGQISVQ